MAIVRLSIAFGVSLYSRSECPDLTKEAHAFFLLLSEDLKKLDHSLAEGSSVSLRWSVEAMNLLKKMQIELVALFKKSQLPISFAPEEEDWFDQFMQETATLLDFCNSLKCTLSEITRYRMVTDLMIQKIIEEDGSASVLNGFEFKMLEEEHDKLSSVVGLRKETVVIGDGRSECSNKSMAAIMLVAKATMIAISLILVSAVVLPIPIETRSEELVSGYPELKVFAEMLTSVVARFGRVLEREEGSRFMLAEREMVESGVGDLRAQVENGEREGVLKSVGVLRTSSDELREGVEMFDAVVDEVFDVVMRGRKEMLGIFRDGVLSM